ncbi:MAG: chorismate-binding protein, partial [Planctomycetota bacterium]
SRDDRDWPDLLMARITGGLAFNHAAGRWWWFGEPASGEREELLAAVRMAERGERTPPEPFTITGPERRSLDDAAHEAAVAEARRAIAAGEIFQANITRRRTLPCAGSVRDLAIAALAAARPRYGAVLEAPGGRGLVSMSPELFLEVRRRPDGLQVARTRPIKGTLPAADRAACDPGPARLLASPKDAAELTMIVDLMRHDLGRVAVPGGVRVTQPRHVETHATVHHAVAEVEAVLRPDVDAAALLAATFPPGSVTGAPKIRAMQVIDRLEPCRRGPYCGAIGWLGDDGAVRLNVAIRTIAMTADSEAPHDARSSRGRIDYASGGGIVADSIPAAERREADVKAEVFRRAIQALRPGRRHTDPAPALQAASD